MQEKDASFVTSQNPNSYTNETGNIDTPVFSIPPWKLTYLPTCLLTRMLTCLLNYLLTHSHTHYKYHIL